MEEGKKELTEEQIKELREGQLQWYKEQIPIAKMRATLAEYHALAVEAELRRVRATIQLAELQSPPIPEKNGSKEDNK